MSQVIYGDHISKGADLRIGACALIFDKARHKVLLTQRSDNGLWCLPGGKMEAGETLEECCQREVWEETGLEIRITRLVGIYSNRDQLVVYRDGNQAQIVVLSFEAEITGGELGISDETTAFGYYSLEEIAALPMHGRHGERVVDALQNQVTPILKT
jgi:8-oxo-dGTP pyrophosphatase MutT (NUDIX family)